MNSAIDERVLELHRLLIGVKVCRHLRHEEDGHVCFRCHKRPDLILCDVCIAQHRAGHDDGQCDLCEKPLAIDFRGDLAEVITYTDGSTKVITDTMQPSPSLERLVLARVHIVGVICDRCYVIEHVGSHERSN